MLSWPGKLSIIKFFLPNGNAKTVNVSKHVSLVYDLLSCSKLTPLVDPVLLGQAGPGAQINETETKERITELEELTGGI